ERAAAVDERRVRVAQDRHELAEVVLDRRAAEREPQVGLQQARGLRRLALVVLDRLRFVEDGAVELDLLEHRDVTTQLAVARDEDVGVLERRRLARALRTVVQDDLAPGSDALDLALPIE